MNLIKKIKALFVKPKPIIPPQKPARKLSDVIREKRRSDKYHRYLQSRGKIKILSDHEKRQI